LTFILKNIFQEPKNLKAAKEEATQLYLLGKEEDLVSQTDDFMQKLENNTEIVKGGDKKIEKMHLIVSDIEEQGKLGAEELKNQGNRIKDQIEKSR